MKKVKKGAYGYVRYEQKKRFLITFAMFAIPIVIYVTGYVQTKTKLNLFTFVAILGCLPACRSLTGLIMMLLQKPVKAEVQEAARQASGNLTAGYEMIFTTYEHTSMVAALVVCGDLVVCYTDDPKTEPDHLEKHISKILTANGYPNVQVKVMKEFKHYLQRVSDICAKQDHLREGLTFTPDVHTPDLTRDETVFNLLLAICL